MCAFEGEPKIFDSIAMEQPIKTEKANKTPPKESWKSEEKTSRTAENALQCRKHLSLHLCISPIHSDS